MTICLLWLQASCICPIDSALTVASGRYEYLSSTLSGPWLQSACINIAYIWTNRAYSNIRTQVNSYKISAHTSMHMCMRNSVRVCIIHYILNTEASHTALYTFHLPFTPSLPAVITLTTPYNNQSAMVLVRPIACVHIDTRVRGKYIDRR